MLQAHIILLVNNARHVIIMGIKTDNGERMVTFETKCYEKDYEFVLRGRRLKESIGNCGHPFEKKILIINNIESRSMVEGLAGQKVCEKIIDEFYFVEDYRDEVLRHFDLTVESFRGGYYYSISELTAIYLCQTPYLLHFSSDSAMEKKYSEDWISDAVSVMEKESRYICANPCWNGKFTEAAGESAGRFGKWYVGHGFSDQCYLIPVSVFKGRIYSESHPASERYPEYGGELFEKRVDSYMRNHDKYRLTHMEANYRHRNFPKSPLSIQAKLLFDRFFQ